MLASINGHPVVSLRLSIPRRGVWHGDAAVDAAGPLTGAVALELDGSTWAGTIQHQDTDDLAGLQRLQFAAGAAGLRAEVPPAGHRAAPLRIPLLDLLTAAGETLSPSSDPAILGLQLAQWSRMRGPAGRALEALMRDRGDWRALPDGSFWVGTDTWSAAYPGEVELLDVRPERDQLVIGLAPTILPGMVLLDRNVSFVEHRVGEDELRTVVWLEL